MPQLIQWDLTGQKFFETGVDRGVFYAMDVNGAYPKGVAWNGLVSVTESPSGGDKNPQYADNIKYLELRGAEDFGGTIECFTYPEEFAVADGNVEATEGVYISQQARKTFGLVYRTKLGNDVGGQDLGYKLHLVYGCTVSPSEKQYQTLSESPEGATFSYEFSCVPVAVANLKPTALVTIDSTKVSAPDLAAFEAILYGSTPSTQGRLPLPDEVVTLLVP